MRGLQQISLEGGHWWHYTFKEGIEIKNSKNLILVQSGGRKSKGIKQAIFSITYISITIEYTLNSKFKCIHSTCMFLETYSLKSNWAVQKQTSVLNLFFVIKLLTLKLTSTLQNRMFGFPQKVTHAKTKSTLQNTTFDFARSKFSYHFIFDFKFEFKGCFGFVKG